MPLKQTYCYLCMHSDRITKSYAREAPLQNECDHTTKHTQDRIPRSTASGEIAAEAPSHLVTVSPHHTSREFTHLGCARSAGIVPTTAPVSNSELSEPAVPSRTVTWSSFEPVSKTTARPCSVLCALAALTACAMLLWKNELIATRPHPTASWPTRLPSSASRTDRSMWPMLNMIAPSPAIPDIAARKRAVRTISRACTATRSRPGVSFSLRSASNGVIVGASML